MAETVAAAKREASRSKRIALTAVEVERTAAATASSSRLILAITAMVQTRAGSISCAAYEGLVTMEADGGGGKFCVLCLMSAALTSASSRCVVASHAADTCRTRVFGTPRACLSTNSTRTCHVACCTAWTMSNSCRDMPALVMDEQVVR